MAVGTTLRHRSRNRAIWNNYYAKAWDLIADERYHTGPSARALLSPHVTKQAWRLLGANYAEQMAGISAFSPIPPPLRDSAEISLIHCNHFFTMPMALALQKDSAAPILLETHDIQAKQYDLRNVVSFVGGRRDSLETLLETELSYCRAADCLIHINADERDFFARKLPGMLHRLLYPCIRTPVDHSLSEAFFLIVASANHPNYLSVKWFLTSVLPLVPNTNIRIAGNIDHEFRAKAPHLYRLFRHCFVGFVEDLGSLYENATAILLPTVAGHGLSIKTVEAMLTGREVIATPLAFRGIDADLRRIPGLQLSEGAADFAGAMRTCIAATRRQLSGTRYSKATAPDHVERVCENSERSRPDRDELLKLFSFEHYLQTLSSTVEEVLRPGQRPAGEHAPHLVGCLNANGDFTANGNPNTLTPASGTEKPKTASTSRPSCSRRAEGGPEMNLFQGSEPAESRLSAVDGRLSESYGEQLPHSLSTPSRRTKRSLMLSYWGRRGALSQLTLELAIAAGRSAAGTTTSISTSNEMFERYAPLKEAIFPVTTFRSPLAAMNVRAIAILRRRLSKRLIVDGTRAFVTLMPHIWSPIIAPTLRKAGIRHTVIIHDADPHPGDPTALVHRWLLGTAKIADHVVTLTHAVAQRLVEAKGIPEEKIFVLYHPDLNYAAERSAEPAGDRSRHRPLRLLFFGRMLPYKGLEVFVEAVQALNNASVPVEVGIFGEGPVPRELERLDNLKTEVVNRWIASSEIREIFERHDLAVVTHTQASQSGVIAAAHGAGIPVVCTPVGGLREQVVPERTGLVAADMTGGAVANAIARFVNEPGLLNRTRQGILDTRSERCVDRFFSKLTEIAHGSRRETEPGLAL